MPVSGPTGRQRRARAAARAIPGRSAGSRPRGHAADAARAGIAVATAAGAGRDAIRDSANADFRRGKKRTTLHDRRDGLGQRLAASGFARPACRTGSASAPGRPGDGPIPLCGHAATGRNRFGRRTLLNRLALAAVGDVGDGALLLCRTGGHHRKRRKTDREAVRIVAPCDGHLPRRHPRHR
ncbi:hypothetical protein D3C72_1838000 [compost metagenome]